MRSTLKLLATVFVTVIISTFYSSTALAAQVNVENQTPVEKTVTEEKDNSGAYDIEQSIAVTAADDSTTDDVYIDDLGQVHDKNLEDADALQEEKEAAIDNITDVEDADEDTAPEDKEADSKSEPKKDTKKTTEKTSTKKPSYSEKDLRLLTALIYSEAGNQPYDGMLGVANVVLNRTHSDAYYYLHTVEDVIYDTKWSVQFAVTLKSKKTGLSALDKALKAYDTGKFTGGNPEAEKKCMKRAIKAAKAALEGENNIGKYLCFQNKRYASSIKKKYADYKIIGDHIFYRSK